MDGAFKLADGDFERRLLPELREAETSLDIDKLYQLSNHDNWRVALAVANNKNSNEFVLENIWKREQFLLNEIEIKKAILTNANCPNKIIESVMIIATPASYQRDYLALMTRRELKIFFQNAFFTAESIINILNMIPPNHLAAILIARFCKLDSKIIEYFLKSNISNIREILLLNDNLPIEYKMFM